MRNRIHHHVKSPLIRQACLCFALVLTAVCLCPSAQAEAVSVPVTVYLDQPIGEISPYLYGQFIEHIESCIYNGLWAEMLLDRKFYYPVGEKDMSPWKAKPKDLVEMNRDLTCGDEQSAFLMEGATLTQQQIALEAVDYTGYLYAACPDGGTAQITVSLRTIHGQQDVSLEIVGNELMKYSYQFACDQDTPYGFFDISVQSGSCVVDSLSLMPADNWHGMRADTLALLKELDATIYRWPGGNFLSGYDWKDGIGDRDYRVSKRNLHYMGLESSFANEAQMKISDKNNLEYLGFYGGIEPNDFGTDEFMLLCEYLECDAMMMVNTGLGSSDDAADLVAYMLGDASTGWGALRAANGHEAPYEVALWGVGNEMFGDWQLGHVSLAEYQKRHEAFVNAMRAIAPDISVVGVGDNWANWSRDLLKSQAANMNYIDEHLYSARHETDVVLHVSDVEANLSLRIRNHRAITAANRDARHVGMMLLEYAYDKVTTPSRLKDGLGIGVFLNTMVNHADAVKGACYSSTINAMQGCITTTDTDAVMQASGLTLMVYRQDMGNLAVRCKHESDEYLSISAAVDQERNVLTLAVVNPHAYAVNINLQGMETLPVSARHVIADHPDAVNTVTEQSVRVVASSESWLVPACSMTVLTVELP